MAASMLITVLLGFAALAVDLGFFYAQRLQQQNAADNAALAAARALWEGAPASSAVDAAQDYALGNGYDLQTTCPPICLPPSEGDRTGDSNFVEVIVEDQPKTFFLHAIVPGAVNVRARGVAGITDFPEEYAIVVLSEHDCDAYLQEGQASMTIVGGGIMVNSDCPADAFTKTGSGIIQAQGSIDVNGGVGVSGSGEVSPDPREDVTWAVENPLSGLAPPAPDDPAPGSPGTAASPETWQISGSPDVTLSPGTYYGGILAECTCTITFQPGVYIMAGGGFTKKGGADLVGDGVMIYVTTNPLTPEGIDEVCPYEQAGQGAAEPCPFNLSGNGVLDLSPPTSGEYDGITFWQDEAITDDFLMAGSNDLVSGIFYVPGATLSISGNSVMGAVQLIVDGFHISGNAPLSLTYGEFRAFEAPAVALVE